MNSPEERFEHWAFRLKAKCSTNRSMRALNINLIVAVTRLTFIEDSSFHRRLIDDVSTAEPCCLLTSKLNKAFEWWQLQIQRSQLSYCTQFYSYKSYKYHILDMPLSGTEF
jgi:hypothetical protein